MIWLQCDDGDLINLNNVESIGHRLSSPDGDVFRVYAQTVSGSSVSLSEGSEAQCLKYVEDLNLYFSSIGNVYSPTIGR